MFQPRCARLKDTFEGTEIKTEEGDLDDDLDNIGDEVKINVLIETNRSCEKDFITLILHNRWEKYVSKSKVQLLSPAAICPTLNAVRSGITAVDPTELLQAVGEVIMGGVYSARRGEGEVVVSHPGNELFTNKSTKIMKILENKHKLHGENFHQLIFTLVHNNLIVHCAFTHY